MLAIALQQLGQRRKPAYAAASAALRCASNYRTQPPKGVEWKLLKLQGARINPCNSALHPSVVDAKMQPEGTKELPMQLAYAGESQCFGCGAKNPDGLQLRSFRIHGGLAARITLAKKHICFPGIVSGGIITTIFDCHGNWSSAVALMDRACLSRPPLTLTAEILVNFKEPVPEERELIVRSQVVYVRDHLPRGAKSQVQVDLSLSIQQPDNEEEPEKLLATATGIFKKLGALRAM